MPTEDERGLLTADEECELAGRIRGGDADARRRLILANLRVVVEIARRFGGGKVPLEDLIQEGNLGLIRASEDFDPTAHGCRFYRYAEVWIRAYIHRALIRDDSIVRVPTHAFVAGRRGGRAAGPGVVPLAEADREPADGRGPDDEAADRECRLLLEIALRRLHPIEAWVIRERYGLGLEIPGFPDTPGASPRPRAYHRRSLAEIGRDCGLSRRRVQQIEAAALDKIRDVLDAAR